MPWAAALRRTRSISSCPERRSSAGWGPRTAAFCRRRRGCARGAEPARPQQQVRGAPEAADDVAGAAGCRRRGGVWKEPGARPKAQQHQLSCADSAGAPAGALGGSEVGSRRPFCSRHVNILALVRKGGAERMARSIRHRGLSQHHGTALYALSPCQRGRTLEFKTSVAGPQPPKRSFPSHRV